jgi:hypothetical protein
MRAGGSVSRCCGEIDTDGPILTFRSVDRLRSTVVSPFDDDASNIDASFGELWRGRMQERARFSAMAGSRMSLSDFVIRRSVAALLGAGLDGCTECRGPSVTPADEFRTA